MACTTSEKAAWAAAIGLPVCIADAFCAAYGRLPASLAELNSWGNATGYRQPDGTWSCTPSPGGGSTPPPPATGGTDLNKLLSNPLVLLGGGFVLLMLLSRR